MATRAPLRGSAFSQKPWHHSTRGSASLVAQRARGFCDEPKASFRPIRIRVRQRPAPGLVHKGRGAVVAMAKPHGAHACMIDVLVGRKKNIESLTRSGKGGDGEITQSGKGKWVPNHKYRPGGNSPKKIWLPSGKYYPHAAHATVSRLRG
eukprot:scaffold661413_cov43-Prasinocladus_malaysianus.AAC.1